MSNAGDDDAFGRDDHPAARLRSSEGFRVDRPDRQADLRLEVEQPGQEDQGGPGLDDPDLVPVVLDLPE